MWVHSSWDCSLSCKQRGLLIECFGSLAGNWVWESHGLCSAKGRALSVVLQGPGNSCNWASAETWPLSRGCSSQLHSFRLVILSFTWCRGEQGAGGKLSLCGACTEARL